MKLHQVVAILGEKKSRAQSELTKSHHMLQKEDLLKGIARTYRPKDDDGERIPSEQKNIQYTVAQGIAAARGALTEMFDMVATQDAGNRDAAADVVVDGKVVLAAVPATTLIFLEKQLTDLRTFVEKLPTLDPAYAWTYDATAGCYVSNDAETVRSKKVYRNHVLHEATKEHPAQVQVYTEDVPVGYWTTRNFSGAIPLDERSIMLSRVRKLREAVVLAREEANRAEVSEQKIGEVVLGFVFGKSA